MKKITLPASSTFRSSALVDAFIALHDKLGQGTLYRYLSKDKKSLVARFFPEDWEKGCAYIPASLGLSPKLTTEELRVLMQLTYINGDVPLNPNFRITTLTQLWLDADIGYDEGKCIFVLTRAGTSKKFSIDMPLDEEDPDLLDKIMAELHRFVWERFPGCSLKIKS